MKKLRDEEKNVFKNTYLECMYVYTIQCVCKKKRHRPEREKERRNISKGQFLHILDIYV